MNLHAGRASRLLIFLWICAIGAGCRPHEPGPEPRSPTVVLVVLDAVRRDRVQPCGYPLPTTPNLVKLAARGTTFCGMVTPGSWTLPVHASIFTGRIPTEHGADFAPGGTQVPGVEVLSVASLPSGLPTLAERFRDAGYQTVLVSGNPVLHPSIGLARGFEITHVALEFGLGPAADVYPAVEEILTRTKVDSGRPLFLFVNIATAHGPFERVPAAVDWLPETQQVIDLFRPLPKPPFWGFHTGAMTTQEEAVFLADLRAAYDWGVRLADEVLGRILLLLEREGWLDDQSLIAITSDHGELLGEHRLLDHGRTVVRENIDVFALLVGPGYEHGTRVDDLVQSQDLYPTLLAGAGLAPSELLPRAQTLTEISEERVAVTVSEPDGFWSRYSDGRVGTKRYVVVQRGSQRVVWSEGEDTRGEVVAGVAPSTAPRGPDAELATLAREIANAGAPRRPTGQLPSEIVRALRGLGYGD